MKFIGIGCINYVPNTRYCYDFRESERYCHDLR